MTLSDPDPEVQDALHLAASRHLRWAKFLADAWVLSHDPESSAIRTKFLSGERAARESMRGHIGPAPRDLR